MADTDVWILGAGASTECHAPTIPEFRKAALDVASHVTGKDRDMLEAGLTFWHEKFPTFNVEEYFGFVDSELGPVTGEGDLSEVRTNTLFLIAKVITDRMGSGVSEVHRRFVDRLPDWVPLVTLNWDILLDNAILSVQRRRVSYVFPGQKVTDPSKRGLRSQKLLKLHGSLNWLHCGYCTKVTVLPAKDPAVAFLRGERGSFSCDHCGKSDYLDVLIVPPVLGKLPRGNQVLNAIWTDAYRVISAAKRVFIIGYSFPPTDIQTRLFISKALREAANLQLVKVVTRPKFGMARNQFEDRYAEMLQTSEKLDLVEFEYSAFGRYVGSGKFEKDLEGSS